MHNMLIISLFCITINYVYYEISYIARYFVFLLKVYSVLSSINNTFFKDNHKRICKMLNCKFIVD